MPLEDRTVGQTSSPPPTARPIGRRCSSLSLWSVLGPIVPGMDRVPPRLARVRMTIGGRRWMRCTFRSWWTQVLAEPAPLRRLPSAVLRRPRTPKAPGPASARGDPRRHPQSHAEGGYRGHLRRAVVATDRHRNLRAPHPDRGTRPERVTATPTPATRCPPGASFSTTSTTSTTRTPSRRM